MEAGRAYDPGLVSTLVELIRSGELSPGDDALVPDVFRSLEAPPEDAPTT